MASKAEFVQAMYEAGLAAGLTDAAARVMAAQAAIESGYGERAPGHNYFAITKGDQWTGPTIRRTDKDANGKPIEQEFRSYGSAAEGIADRIAFMDQRFPGFNRAATTEEALNALQNGVKGKYYEAPRAKYEDTVKGIQSKYLNDAHPVPPADVAFSPNTFLGGKQYGKPGGGVGVNADKLHPEFSNRMAALIQAAEAATGEQVSIFEGYRDPKRQAQLRANYLNQPIQWEGVTYTPNGKGYKAAAPGHSQHQLGMATDIRVGSEPDKAPSGPAFEFMREHAEEYGLHWFGSSDPAHFEMPDADYQTALKGGVVPQFKLPKQGAQPVKQTAVASQVDNGISGLQRQLADRGFDPGPIDGKSGPLTKAAIKAFQESRGLVADGIVGPKTTAALNEAADMSVTPRLGWDGQDQTYDGRQTRQIIPSSDNAVARLTADNVGGLGSVSDDRLSSLLGPTRSVPQITEGETRAEQRSLGMPSTGTSLGAPTPRSRPFGSVAAMPEPQGGNILTSLGNTVGQGLTYLGSKAQDAGRALGDTATNVVEGTGRALQTTGRNTADLLKNELMGTVKGRTLLLNTLTGNKPAMRADDRAAARNASAPEGYGYGSTGKKLYKIGQQYQSSKGPVIFNGTGFQPVQSGGRPTAVKTQLSIPNVNPSATYFDRASGGWVNG